jgi:hypothetical protein
VARGVWWRRACQCRGTKCRARLCRQARSRERSSVPGMRVPRGRGCGRRSPRCGVRIRWGVRGPLRRRRLGCLRVGGAAGGDGERGAECGVLQGGLLGRLRAEDGEDGEDLRDQDGVLGERVGRVAEVARLLDNLYDSVTGHGCSESGNRGLGEAEEGRSDGGSTRGDRRLSVRREAGVDLSATADHCIGSPSQGPPSTP